jgi:hypothetical protein
VWQFVELAPLEQIAQIVASSPDWFQSYGSGWLVAHSEVNLESTAAVNWQADAARLALKSPSHVFRLDSALSSESWANFR